MSGRIIHNATAPIMRGATLNDLDFALSYSSGSTLVVPGNLSQETVADIIYDKHTESTYDPSYTILIDHVSGERSDLLIVSKNETIAEVSDNKVTRVADGFANIVVGNHLLKRTLTLDMTRQIGATTYQVNGYAAGSLAKHIAGTIDGWLINKTPATSLKIYTTQNHASKIYGRNPDLYCAELNMTCVSPWNSYGGNTLAGTAITARHVILAKHYKIPVGATIRFITLDNAVVDRVVAATADVPNSSDHTILTLDSDLPETITPAKVFPANLSDYIPCWNYVADKPSPQIPMIVMDYEEKALVLDTSLGAGNSYSVYQGVSTRPARKSFGEKIIPGDSGNPGIVPVNGSAVLCCTQFLAGVGCSLFCVIPEINAILAADGDYELDVVGLSDFTNFGA